MQSDGWRRFHGHVTEEWGAAAYARKMEAAVKAAATNLDPQGTAQSLLFQLTSIRLEMLRVMQWPVERTGQCLAALRGQSVAGRGGY